jgi:hypothetical protein
MIWLQDGDEVPDREKHMIQTPKLMFTFGWNPDGFHVVDAMPSHAKRRDVQSRLVCPNYRDRDRFVARRGAEREVKGGWSCMRIMQGKAAYSKSNKSVLGWHFLANCTTSAFVARLISL